jgi:hypothetical protein
MSSVYRFWPVRWEVAGGLAVLFTLLLLVRPGLAGATSRPPAFGAVPRTAIYLASASSSLTAGSRGFVVIHTGKLSACSLRFRGPGGGKAGPYSAHIKQFGRWTWTVPRGVRVGHWVAKVRCGRTRLDTTIAVHGALSGKAPVAVKHGVRLKRYSAAVHAVPLPADGVGGRGGGGYPDANAVDCSAKYGVYSWCENGWWISPRGFGYRNCTDFVAWFLGLTWADFKFPASKGNAADWGAYAANAGLTVTQTPSVGDVAWWDHHTAGGYGHVAIVTAINSSNNSVTVAEYNGDGHGDYDVRPNMHPTAYLQPKGVGAGSGSGSGSPTKESSPPQSTALMFTVQNTDETPPDGVYFRNSPHAADTSRTPGLGVYMNERVQLICYGWGDAVGPYNDKLWYDVSNVTRPTANGVANDGWLNAHYIADGKSANELDAGVPVCPGYSATQGSTPPPAESTPAPTPPPPAPSPTYSETTGGVAHTWTNYTNAGGAEGPSIPSNDTVQIACKVTGFRVEDGNTWWYRIASSPWSNNYYVSADAFYNNGKTSGSLIGTPFVDGNVPNC